LTASSPSKRFRSFAASRQRRMGKRRNTAKTGDKAIYKSRPPKHDVPTKGRHSDTDNDHMYNEIDRFHNQRDQEEFIRFCDAEIDGEDDDKDLVGNMEAVLDLGLGDESSTSGDDDGDDDYSTLEHQRKAQDTTRGDKESPYDSDSYSDSDSDDEDDDDDVKNLKEQLKTASEDPRNWGKKKSMYYHGDTADLEIGQEKEDAFLEEEAAKEVQASRFQEMDEDDFVLSDHEADMKAMHASELITSKAENIKSIRDISKLSKKEARKLLRKQHPELLPMVSYFADIVRDLKERTDVATKALMEDAETAEASV
jgi:U3 small nucleolar RNA-associated protein 3